MPHKQGFELIKGYHLCRAIAFKIPLGINPSDNSISALGNKFPVKSYTSTFPAKIRWLLKINFDEPLAVGLPVRATPTSFITASSIPVTSLKT